MHDIPFIKRILEYYISNGYLSTIAATNKKFHDTMWEEFVSDIQTGEAGKVVIAGCGQSLEID
ncbi:hypothetical protein [Aggregatilinea lenta]|uniref:hypothetical protein n=1 Tax=Aggregatilinea lenta TaxID=913108 RepID=UPI0013C2A97F|nr:hypothetical protein [Aggregatilinea lenta]